MSVANNHEVISNLDLNLVITDRNVLRYLSQFPSEELQIERTLEALKVGVISIQSASPTLDATVVQSAFAELNSQMRDQTDSFCRSFREELRRHFDAKDGMVPRSIDEALGKDGVMAREMDKFLDPDHGVMARVMQSQLGPESAFGKAIDPENKQGVIAILEARVQELVEAKLDDVLKEFSLDEHGSAMSRMNGMLTESLNKIHRSLGHQDGQEEEAQRGHVKGLRFEKELYENYFVSLCTRLDDEPSFVGGTPGHLKDLGPGKKQCKTGDLLSTLGDTTGAPGTNIVIEVKDREEKLKDARQELQEAKSNRRAAVGIYVWSRGNEPAEVGDFRRIGEDYYVTVDREDLQAGRPLLYLDAAYGIARAMAVASARMESADEIDLAGVQNHIEALQAWAERLADMATKSRTVQKNGKLIEDITTELKADMDTRLAAIHEMLRKHAA